MLREFDTLEPRRATAPCGSRWCTVNPLREPAWDSLLDSHPGSCFFHTTDWARVLHETYGHEPLYFCEITGRKLLGLLPIMQVSTPLLGLRGVSLPFTDFCSPLFSAQPSAWDPYELAIQCGKARGWKSLECRSNNHRWPGALTSRAFYAHLINLDQRPDSLLKTVKASVRTAIRKAYASGLRIEFSQGIEAVRGFYRLHVRTRRRHGVPPQPLRFFENIARHVLASGHGVVVSAFLGQKPLAASVFFYRGRQAIFKFGASEGLRPNNLVMWEAMKWLQQRGVTSLHLGRTSIGNGGLRRFKLGFGAHEELLTYVRCVLRDRLFAVGDTDPAHSLLNSLFRCLPVPLLRLAGTLLYPRFPG